MKRVYYIILLALFFTMSVNAQYAELKGSVLEINEDMFGYNTNTYLRGPLWSNSEMRFSAGRLHIGNIRYPAGTGSNYWDWRTGNIMKTINTGWPKWVNDDYTYTPATFVAGIPKGASVVYCINMARPTPATGISPYSSIEVLKSQATLDKKIIDIIEGIDAFYDAGYELKMVELGNEFYHGAVGGVDEQGAIYTGMPELYIDHANQVAQAIHNKYPDIRMAIIGEDSRSGEEPVVPWTQAIYNAIEDGRLKNIDAITFHLYTGPGPIDQLTNSAEAMKSLAQTFNAAKGNREGDYTHVPAGLEIWITEYNTWSPTGSPDNGGPIKGTWVNGLFGANLSLQYPMMGYKVKLLNLHVLGQGAHEQWEMLYNQNTLSGNGVACGAVGRAMTGMNRMQVLDFKSIPSPTFTNGWPSLIGAKFWNGDDQRASVLIINNTDQAKNNLNITRLFNGYGSKQLMQFYDETPWNSVVTEDNGITYNMNNNLGDVVDIPPFSITVITQDYEDLLANSGFEASSLDGWSGDGVLDKTYKNANKGSGSLLLEQNAASMLITKQEVAISKSESFVLRAEIRTLLESGSAYVQLKFFNEGGFEVGPLLQSSSITGTKAYVEEVLNFEAPNSAVKAEVQLIMDGVGKAWFDDIVLSHNGLTSVKNHIDFKELLTLFPNPSNSFLNVVLNNLQYGEIEQVDVLRTDGQKIGAYLGQNQLRIDVSNWSKGIYILSVKLADYPIPLISKFVVE